MCIRDRKGTEQSLLDRILNEYGVKRPESVAAVGMPRINQNPLGRPLKAVTPVQIWPGLEDDPRPVTMRRCHLRAPNGHCATTGPGEGGRVVDTLLNARILDVGSIRPGRSWPCLLYTSPSPRDRT